MVTIDVHTARDGLVAFPNSASPDVTKAYFYTFTKAQMVARAVNPDPSTPAYFDTMVAALRPLGWTAVKAGAINVPTGQLGQIPLVAMASALARVINDGGIPIAPVTITDAAISLVPKLLSAPADITASLDAWWSGTSISASVQIMAVGTIFEPLGVPVVPLGWFECSMSGSSWRDLLRPCDDFSFVLKPVLLTLNLRAYDRISADLAAQLSAQLHGHISSTTIDLSAMTLEAVA
jgi:hypothetical protein